MASLRRWRQVLWPRAASVSGSDWQLVPAIKLRAGTLRQLSDQQLGDSLARWRQPAVDLTMLARPAALVGIFAAGFEAVRRELGITLYDEQLLAGLAMARGAVAEMQTGEGKTLAAALPALALSVAGRGVHVAAPNQYLAQRDFEQLQPVFARLGVRAALLPAQGPPERKAAAYRADITYGAGYEFGFDFLRDQLTLKSAQEQRLGARHRLALRGLGAVTSPPLLQREQACAIIDEIDSVLIDEACTPLVLSFAHSALAADEDVYQRAQDAAALLRRDQDYLFEPAARQIKLTARGLKNIHHRAGAVRGLRRPWSNYVQQALVARCVLQADVDYVVRDGRVVLVDEFTGRLHEDRTWRGGLQQAVEAKEQVPIQNESATATRISRQRAFKMYEHICGMTGTATGSERELQHQFGLAVVQIPLHRRSQRQWLPTRVFTESAAKFRGIVADIVERHGSGQPVLVGSRSIENSQRLSAMLFLLGVPHALLNGKQDAPEAGIVAAAGTAGQVTIATNMAGRGTDIRLAPGVAERGGLHVIGVEHHESPRIDRQLAGRAARQGAPGSVEFFLAPDDPLVARFGGDFARRAARMPAEACEITRDCAAEIRGMQQRAAAAAWHDRQAMLAHDRWCDEVLEQLSDRTG